jgi:hypothetical protein
MAFEFEYMGFKVSFAENDEVWRCWALDVEHKSMAKVKSMISQKVREEVKTANLIYGIKNWGSVKKVQVIGLVDGKGDHVWTKSMDRDERRSREKMDTLFPWTLENEAIIAEADVLEKQGNALLSLARKKREEIKSMTEQSLANLIGEIKKKVVDENGK